MVSMLGYSFKTLEIQSYIKKKDKTKSKNKQNKTKQTNTKQNESGYLSSSMGKKQFMEYLIDTLKTLNCISLFTSVLGVLTKTLNVMYS